MSDEGWGSGYGDEDYGNEESPSLVGSKIKGYEVLSTKAVKDKMMTFLSELNELYALNDNDLMKLARYYKWNASKMQNDWFSASPQK
jgi:hypothetical protein